MDGIMNKCRFMMISLTVVSVCASCTVFLNLRPQDHYDLEFHNNVCIQPYSRYTYRVGSSMSVKVENEEFIIPAGFETDLASIPRWYWAILAPQYSAFVVPSIIHDYFYRCVNLKNREFADSVFYYALLKNGVSHYTASKFYLAVRLFGAHYYSKDKSCESVLFKETAFNSN